MMLVLVALVVGCGGDDETAMTTTEAASIESPAHTLECNINTEQYGFMITGEEFPMATQTRGESTQREYDAGDLATITIEVNRTISFEASGNSYDLIGSINVDFQTSRVRYDIVATSDAFEEPQSCRQ